MQLRDLQANHAAERMPKRGCVASELAESCAQQCGESVPLALGGNVGKGLCIPWLAMYEQNSW